MMAADEGGRHTPTFEGYRPDFRATTEGHGDVTLGPAEVKLPADNPMLLPGTELDVELTPVDAGQWLQVSTGLVLGVFEGDHQVGTATVLER
jgi:translation elongation factor EF-Tu-like GTPase